MGKLNKTRITILAIAVAAFLSVSGVRMIFYDQTQNIEVRIAQGQRLLAEHGELLSRKKELETEWESKKGYFPASSSAEGGQNAWLKELLTYAQSQAIVLEKLEPAGIKGGPGGNESLIFLSFQADIRKLTAFLYHLLESEPLTKVESFFVRQDDSRKNFSYEFILARVVK